MGEKKPKRMKVEVGQVWTITWGKFEPYTSKITDISDGVYSVEANGFKHFVLEKLHKGTWPEPMWNGKEAEVRYEGTEFPVQVQVSTGAPAVPQSASKPKQRYFGLPPDNHPDRKSVDPFNGCIAFFPDALAEVSRISTTAGRKYNDGHTAWHEEKGGDRHASKGRHFFDIAKMRGKLGEPGWADKHGEEAVAAYAALAWDVLAPLQQLIERLNATQADKESPNDNT